MRTRILGAFNKLMPFLLMLFPFAVFCQNSDSSQTNRKEMGITLSPEYWNFSRSYQREIPKLSFTIGVNFLFPIKNKIVIETGVLLSNLRYRTTEAGVYSYYPFAQIGKSYHVYNIALIGIPLKIHFYLLTKRLKVFVSGGISTTVDLASKGKEKIKYNDGTTKVEKSNWRYSNPFSYGFSPVIFAEVGLGIKYEINRLLYIGAQPYYRHSIPTYLSGVGMVTGVYLKL